VVLSQAEAPRKGQRSEFILVRQLSPREADYNENVRLSVPSSIAGSWAMDIPGQGEKALVTIKRDGTFDLTATGEGSFHGWHQLRYPGDYRFFFTKPLYRFRVASAKYNQTSSHISMDAVLVDGGQRIGHIDLDASLAGNDTLKLSLSFEMAIDGRTQKVNKQFALNRASPGILRVESVLSATTSSP
jgi:hypothetical protein